MGGHRRSHQPRLDEALTRLSYVHSLAGDLAAAKQIGDRAAAVGRLRGATPSETLAQQAYVRLLTGEFADSRSLVQQALVGDDAGDHAIWGRVRCSLVLALATWYLGRYDEARETVARILSTVGVDGEPRVAASVMPLLVWLGETGRSRDITRMATSAGHDDLLTGVLWPGDTGDGWIRVHGGQIAEGVFLLRRSAQRLGAISLRSWLPYTLAWLSEGLRIEGEPDDAAAAAEEGLNIVRQTGARCCDAELYRMRGEAIAARAGSRSGSSATRDHDAAEASCWAAITVARQQDARTLELQATLSLARLLRDTGRREEAVRVLAPVCYGFASSDRTPDLAEARRVIAEGAR